ncbi:MAG: TauD/TfdA family dioxygenase [Burkholderiaceae bacterium]
MSKSVMRAEYSQPSGRFSNHAHSYRHIKADPLSSAMGAGISGVNLRSISDDALAEVKDALFHHKMVFFRDQQLSIADQEALTEKFGEFGVDAYTAGIDGHPNVQQVLKEAGDVVPLIFGGTWHTDSAFLVQPPALSILYGVDIPPYGGDTWWANSALAYDTLSEAMKQLISPLRVEVSGRKVQKTFRAAAKTKGKIDIASMDTDFKDDILGSSVFHPLVRTHPVTGAKSLYVCPTYSVGLEGFSAREAAPLVDFLTAHITQPMFTCRLQWQPNTLVIWDNRACVHHAFNDHDGFRREMRRTIVQGEVPV